MKADLTYLELLRSDTLYRESLERNDYQGDVYLGMLAYGVPEGRGIWIRDDEV